MATSIRIDDLAQPRLTEVQRQLLAWGETTLVDFGEEAILAAARERTGLSDFGPDEFRERLLARLGELRREHGTADRPFQIHAGAPDMDRIEGFRRLEDLGGTHGVASVWNVYETPPTLEAKLEAVRRLGGEVIAKFRR